WKFLFIYPKALPALATQALMVDGEGYKTTYQYLDNTEPSQVSVGRWNDHLGATESYYNKGKALPLMLRFCWDSIIDKKSYETLIFFKKGTWEQMVTPYTDNRWNETYYRSTMIIGLAPEGKVRVWLGDRGNPVVPQLDAKITTVSGDKMKMCKGVTKHPDGYVYYGDTPDFIKGKIYPYGNW
ncbi:T6SS immunity phospholipase A1-binding lipoprotein Tli1-EAEC, partial [Escherichia coli]